MMQNIYFPRQAKIEKIFPETADTRTFRLASPGPYLPGQFFQFGILGVGESPVSVASYSKEYVELCVRNVGNVTSKIFALKEGAKAQIRGPYGNGYPIKDLAGANLIVIGGGTGVAPLRSVLRYVEANRKQYSSVDVFFGFRTPDDILFRKDIERWKELFNLRLTVDKQATGWKGNVGLVTDALQKADLPKENSAVLFCGPPIMMKFAVKQLLQAGFDEAQMWVSYERMMKCGLGKCGHCMVQEKHVCADGPVFNYSEARLLEE